MKKLSELLAGLLSEEVSPEELEFGPPLAHGELPGAEGVAGEEAVGEAHTVRFYVGTTISPEVLGLIRRKILSLWQRFRQEEYVWQALRKAGVRRVGYTIFPSLYGVWVPGEEEPSERERSLMVEFLELPPELIEDIARALAGEFRQKSVYVWDVTANKKWEVRVSGSSGGVS